MAEQNPMARWRRSEPTAAEKQELHDEALVLDRLLVHFPTHLQESDLQRELQLGEDASTTATGSNERSNQLHWAGPRPALRPGRDPDASGAPVPPAERPDPPSTSEAAAMDALGARQAFARAFGANVATVRSNARA